MSTFEGFDNEQWLANRLRVHGARIFDGDTNVEGRKERFRQTIELVGPPVICGRDRDGKNVTYAQAFEKLFGEPLARFPKAPEAHTANPDAQMPLDSRAPV